MNAKAKRRLAVVTGVIVIVMILTLAIVGGNSAARTVPVAEALELADDAKIQVTGNVAENSFTIEDDVLTFQIYDPEVDPAAETLLPVRYDGGVAATFGNDVTAICTGKKNAEGTLVCSELVTKCPSKYENATDSLSVTALLDYGEKVYDKPVLVSGVIGEDGVASVDADERFVLLDTQAGESAQAGDAQAADAQAGENAQPGESAQEADARKGGARAGTSRVAIPVVFMGALPEDMAAGSRVVLTGSLGADGAFTATNIAFEA